MKQIKYLSVVLFVALLCSCGSTRKITYLQHVEDVNLEQSRHLYDARIMPKDVLSITVSTVNPEAAAPFNQTVPTVLSHSQQSANNTSLLQSYLVDNNGQIDYPIIGTIKVAGLTKSECEQLILSKIRPYMNENERPLITVRMFGYKISVIGEVNRPGMYTVGNEKINIFEALAQAGDLTIYGVRKNVKLIREDATGKKEIHTINLNEADLVTSPYYYLQQNDIVYVEPNKVKSRGSAIGSSTTIWFSATSILISLTSLLYNILR